MLCSGRDQPSVVQPQFASVIGNTLKRAGLVKRVVGYSKSPSTTERARLMGVIDVEAPSALLAVSGADIVLLAVPVAATEATFKAIRHLVTPNMLIMDVGSTKRDVVDAARRVLREQMGGFVPAHPVAGREVALTGLELDILVALLRRAGRVVPREALLAAAGRDDVVVGERAVDVHISHLRQKLGDDPREPRRIKTVRGVGYVLAKEPP